MFPIGNVKSPNYQLGGAEGEKTNRSHVPPEVPSPNSVARGSQRFSEAQMVPPSPLASPDSLNQNLRTIVLAHTFLFKCLCQARKI